jgi:hypothetical protein
MASKPTTETKLEQSFKDMLAKHGLTAIDIGLNARIGGSVFFSAYVHREPGICAQGLADTIEEALAKALAKLPPAAGLADEALPELAA